MTCLLVFLFIIGACIGSFLGVCVDRIPRGKSVIFGHSHCACGAPIPPYLNVPILAWLLLRGRSKCCGARIPFKFFLLELLTGFLLPIMFLSQRDATRTAIFFSLTCCLLVVSFIDIDTMELPDFLTIGLAGIGLVVSIIFPKIHGTTNVFASAHRSVFGLLCGTGILFWIGMLGEWIFKKEAIGLGDIKLIGAIGTFCGTKGCLYAIFGGSATGTLFILPFLLWRLLFPKKKSHTISILPFAPFLSLGTILFILCGKFSLLL